MPCRGVNWLISLCLKTQLAMKMLDIVKQMKAHFTYSSRIQRTSAKFIRVI